MISTVTGRGEMVLLRGQLIPIHRLHQLFSVAHATEDPTQGLLVVVEHEGQRCALLADGLLGQQQVVIKSLGSALGDVRRRFRGGHPRRWPRRTDSRRGRRPSRPRSRRAEGKPRKPMISRLRQPRPASGDETHGKCDTDGATASRPASAAASIHLCTRARGVRLESSRCEKSTGSCPSRPCRERPNSSAG